MYCFKNLAVFKPYKYVANNKKIWQLDITCACKILDNGTFMFVYFLTHQEAAFRIPI